MGHVIQRYSAFKIDIWILISESWKAQENPEHLDSSIGGRWMPRSKPAVPARVKLTTGGLDEVNSRQADTNSSVALAHDLQILNFKIQR